MATLSEDRPTSDGASEPTKGDENDPDLDAKIDTLKAQIDAIEQEADRLRSTDDAAAGGKDGDKILDPSADELWRTKMEVDARSIYVGQVDYSTTPEDLGDLLGGAGTVNRVTILCDRWTGHPKGYAYVEFEEVAAVERAMRFNGHPFRNRFLKVAPKRTNFPWWMQQGKGKGAGKGRQAGGTPFHMRGRGPSWFSSGYQPYASPYGGYWRGRGRGGRGRGRGTWY
eukprot:Hpha_TRINITY_DN13326_c0_g1::TRINITY_DN13326_c0_g1_i1::g.95564::m.95564/K14396/PABPN1, PABP2; polyadenylate-binding protein 2